MQRAWSDTHEGTLEAPVYLWDYDRPLGFHACGLFETKARGVRGERHPPTHTHNHMNTQVIVRLLFKVVVPVCQQRQGPTQHEWAHESLNELWLLMSNVK